MTVPAFEARLSDDDVKRVAQACMNLMLPALAEMMAKTSATADDELITRKEAAALLKISLTTFDKRRNDGKIPAGIGEGRLQRWRKRDITKGCL